MMFSSKCFIIGVTGGKGGVGKSVFAANLACALKNSGGKTLLVDFDKNSAGDQNILLGSQQPTSIAHFTSDKLIINNSNVDQKIKPVKSGINYLSAVKNIEENFFVSMDTFLTQLGAASSFFKYIILDLGSDLGPEQMTMLQHLSCCICVTNDDILTLNQTKKMTGKLISSGIASNAIFLCINKAGQYGIATQAIQNSLKHLIIGRVPQEEQLIQKSISNGTPFTQTNPNEPTSKAFFEIVKKLNGGLLVKAHELKQKSPIKKPTSNQSKDNSTKNTDSKNSLQSLKLQIHNKLIEDMNLEKDMSQSKGDDQKEAALIAKTKQFISQVVDSMGSNLNASDRNKVIQEVLDESLGLGPLESLLKDTAVSEIMVNGANQIFIERNGKIALNPITFTSNLQLRNVIERICAPIGRRIDEKTPYVDARLGDGSRVNAVIEPLSIDGPALTIRKFPSEQITMKDYTDRFFSLDHSMAAFLKIAVEQGLNVIISGGTGSGKTTLLNVLSSFIPETERIITVEDAAELQLKQAHVVRLETRPANIEGEGAVEIRDLIRNSLRMRPDRIVVGECRDGAALDMLSAMNTGHDGSMTTVHANNPREAISRLETLCLMAGMDLPAKAIREQIAGAVDMIIQICRLSDGSRKVMSITEVVGMQGDVITLQEVYQFKESGFDKNRKIVGRFQALGIIPSCIQDFENRGIKVPRELFTSKKSEPTTTAPKPTSISKPKPNATKTASTSPFKRTIKKVGNE